MPIEEVACWEHKTVLIIFQTMLLSNGGEEVNYFKFHHYYHHNNATKSVNCRCIVRNENERRCHTDTEMRENNRETQQTV